MKMKKNILSVLCALGLCMAVVTPAFAKGNIVRLVDNAGLLTEAEQSELLAKLDDISERQQADIVVVTTNALDGKTAVEYADDFYDDNGYGYGEEADGALLLISMEDRDWCISTSGYGMTAITDDGVDYISDKVLSYLKDEDYEKAFSTYAELCDEFFAQAKSGEPYDGKHMPKEPFNTVIMLLVALGTGMVLALVITGLMKSKLKSVKMQSAAGNYIKKNSMNITESTDLFLYRNVVRTEKPKSEKSSGGSSTHSSSSGKKHGGGSGKF